MGNRLPIILTRTFVREEAVHDWIPLFLSITFLLLPRHIACLAFIFLISIHFLLLVLAGEP